MYLVSVTRLRVRSFWYLPQFFLANERSVTAIKQIAGFVRGKELMDKNRTFWTVSVWESQEAVKKFRNNDPHKQAMRKLPNWCDEAAYAHWEQDTADIPDWTILHERLLGEGRLTKVRYPSIQQGAMAYPPPQRTTTQRPIDAVETK